MKKMQIPLKYLSRLGEYSVKVQGVPVKAISVLSDEPLVEKHMNEFILNTLESTTKLVVVDIKTDSKRNWEKLVVLYSGTHFLIIHHCSTSTLPKCAKTFLQNGDKFCILKPKHLDFCDYVKGIHDVGVKIEDLAARVLQKPKLIQAKLAEIASEVGVPYEGPAKGTGPEIELLSANTMVLSEEQVKIAIHDAFSMYQIGHNLLTHVKSLEDLTKVVSRLRRKNRKKFLKIRVKIPVPTSCFSIPPTTKPVS